MSLFQFMNNNVRSLANTSRWTTFPTVHEESVAEHTLEVTMLSWIFAEQTQGADPNVAIKRALLHDIEETGTGDIPRWAKRESEELEEALGDAEDAIVRRSLSELEDEDLEGLFYELWSESKSDDIEGDIVSAADIICAVYGVYKEMSLGNDSLFSQSDIADGISDAKEICYGIPPAERLLNDILKNMAFDFDLNVETMTPSDAENPVEDGFVYFWAEWCGPCDQQGPIMDELKEDGYNVKKVDVDENPQTAEDLGVQSLPTILLFKDGEVTQRFKGLSTPNELTAAL